MARESSAAERPYDVVSLRGWLRGGGGGDDVTPPLPLVDLRPAASFAERRLGTSASKKPPSFPMAAAAVVVNLPLADLLSGERSCELPPRNLPFAVLVPRDGWTATSAGDGGGDDCAGDGKEEEIGRACCEGDGGAQEVLDPTIERLFFRDTSRLTGKSVRPWMAEQLVLETEGMWLEAENLGVLRTGAEPPGYASAPEPRLWKPDGMVRDVVLPLLRWRLEEMAAGGSDVTSGTTARSLEVWDLGSGAGRDVAFLAEESRARWAALRPSPTAKEACCSFPLQFVGIDNHSGSPRRCLPLWRHRAVSNITESRMMDLSRVEEVHNHLVALCSGSERRGGFGDRGGVLCLYAVRYLNRKLLHYLARDRRCPLPAGTVVALCHFCKNNVDQHSWNFDHPKEKHVLKRDEMRNLFSVGGAGEDDGDPLGGWDVIRDDITSDDDLGRPLIHFVAIKR